MILSDIAELNRIKALNDYGIMDTEAEGQFDAITRLTSYICKTPIALISFIDQERHWIKSGVGNTLIEIPRIHSLCAHTIQNDSVLIINDLKKDERFLENPYVVGEPCIRFYAGAPLITYDGHRIGTLCVADFTPSTLDQQQEEALSILAQQVMSHLEIRRKNYALQKMLNQSSEFQNLFNNSGELHGITDSEGTIEFLSASVFRLLGYHPEEVIGKNIWDFCIEGEQQRVMPKIYQAISAGEDRFQIETAVVDKSGGVRWFEWSDVVVNGRWFINGRDITKRKKTERRLQNLSLAVEKSPAGVIIRNAENKVTWMNQAAERITGYDLADLKNRLFGDMLLGKSSDQSTVEYANQKVLDMEMYEVEITLYKKDGTPFWAFISNNPLFNEDGKLESYVGMMVDITSKKQAEEQLIKTRQDAIDLSKSKEVFLSVMSHEIRTPLNAVIGISRILNEEDPLERQKENLNLLQFSAQNVLSLINDVLDFTKVETGNLKLEHTTVNLHMLANQICDSLRFKCRDKKFIIECTTDKRIPEAIQGDSTRIYQILMNMLGNSTKFTEEGTVSLALSLKDEDDESVTVTFRVADTGIGIQPDKLPTIFDAYTQAESHTARKYGGTGLGLAITKKLIELHQSSIDVESEPGKGTVFSFAIKFLKTPAGTKTEEEPPEDDQPISGYILVVDDNAMNRFLAQKILEKKGIKTDLAENGMQAIDKVKANRYDLVLMDINMPVMDGLEASKAIRTMKQYEKLPIIALTASVLKEHEGKYLAAGMNDFVLKPFNPKDLYKKIRAFIP